MHPNPAYRGADRDTNLAFARQRGFGVLTLAGAEGPLASHLPFAIDEAGGRLIAHIVRSNPIWRRLRAGPAPALMIVSGPDGYISPDWYGMEDQVPTWNYVAVHLRGALRLSDEAEMRGHLDRLSHRFEAALAPKPEWTLDKMPDAQLDRMMRMIAPVEMTVEAVDGTWKLAQNKPAAARRGAAAGLRAGGAGQEVAALAALMEAAD